MTKQSTQAMPIYAMLASTSDSPHDRQIFKYELLPKEASKQTMKDEFKVLLWKFKKLRLKVEERVPIHSQLEDFKWYISKNKFGIYTVALADTSKFEEEFVFSMRRKIEDVLISKKELFLTPSAETEVGVVYTRSVFLGCFLNLGCVCCGKQ